MIGLWKDAKPETRQLVIKAAAGVAVVAVVGVVTMVAVIANNSGLDGLYQMILELTK